MSSAEGCESDPSPLSPEPIDGIPAAEMVQLIRTLRHRVAYLEAEKQGLLERNADLEFQMQHGPTANHPSDSPERLIGNLANRIRASINLPNLLTRLRSQRHREHLVSTLASQIQDVIDLPDLFKTTVQDVRLLLNCDRVLLYQFNPDRSGTIVAESVECIPLLR
ncbi:hypothetical protein BST81_11770 [Leptolyngbya sp. 'hensonii']|uniref:hypothetical protein n=1 Tax=Leptolyngbya sp. 'hensonii' TaxID=1922337 RepID=UPI00094FF636|nr:hypothetical protein [Leptolyngbya sp. 'hensonii']OLP18229.1 hypothetical protein BST81_11770 [Leptolyngbya sp. 'hensonii']